ncbi:hypothetical protein BpHYR1_037210 [Brachionus plicatilis]|uniref:Uncharacterized protein n=1 Tax=Brachionus plicatilis TaxID=10195 RepID=A0A3M7SMW5_BRAPC|nr:hypothetical protein BpHYR1_037210 [Brachionus plicatilis]
MTKYCARLSDQKWRLGNNRWRLDKMAIRKKNHKKLRKDKVTRDGDYVRDKRKFVWKKGDERWHLDKG